MTCLQNSNSATNLVCTLAASHETCEHISAMPQAQSQTRFRKLAAMLTTLYVHSITTLLHPKRAIGYHPTHNPDNCNKKMSRTFIKNYQMPSIILQSCFQSTSIKCQNVATSFLLHPCQSLLEPFHTLACSETFLQLKYSAAMSSRKWLSS